MKKTKEDNNMTNCIDPLYTKNEIELSWPIRYGTIYHKEKTR